MSIKLLLQWVEAEFNAFRYGEGAWIFIEVDLHLEEKDEREDKHQKKGADRADTGRHDIAITERELVDRLCENVEVVGGSLWVTAAGGSLMITLFAHKEALYFVI